MNNNINLVGNQETESLKEKKRLRIVRIAAIGSLVFVTLTSLLIFILYSALSLSSIKKDQDSALNSISFLHKQAAELAVVNSRLTDINNILKKRKDYTKAITTIKGLMPDGVNISEIEVSKDDLAIVVTSNSLQSLNTFLTGFTNLAKKQQTIEKVFIESLTLNQKVGNYSLSLKATLL